MRTFFTFLVILTATVVSAQNGWVQRTNLAADGRHRATGCSIGNKGYIGLGHVNGNTASINYADWWEYDPASDSWTQKANFPTVNYGAVCFAASGKAFVGGGAFLNDEFYSFSPLTNTWTAIPDCPATPGDQGAMSINDKGYVISGNLLYEYDPLTTLWTQKATGPITFGTWCVAFSTGTSGYVKSGTSLFEYKPLNDQWIQRATFPGQNTNGGAAMMHDHKAYIVSGYVGSLAVITNEVWEYNPGNNVWTRMADFPGSARRFSVAFTINNRGYFGTGTHGINLNDFWEMQEPVGLSEQPAGNVVIASPVPAGEFVTIDLRTAFSGEEQSVQMYNATGELVREQLTESGRCVFRRDELPPGIYMYSVRVGSVVHSGKIIFR